MLIRPVTRPIRLGACGQLYRDCVINAFNRDMPFDQFTIEQIAGDLLPNATTDQKVASGFNRNTMFNTEGGVDREQSRVETIVDRVNTTATVWLGTTLGCAQCHTHKYDPFTLKEYYQMFAFFNNEDEPEMQLPSESQKAHQDKLSAELERLDGDFKKQTPERTAAESAWETKALADLAHPIVTPPSTNKPPVPEIPTNIVEALKIAPDGRSDKQKDAPWPTVFDPRRRSLKDLRDQLAKSHKELDDLNDEIPSTLVMKERDEPRESHVLQRGNFLSPAERVFPGVPAILPPLPAGQATNRILLARWLVSPENPLTARVTVNRFWEQIFGRGIVETAEDFGTQGEHPTHPELLDWLATEFVRKDWNVKAMLRLLVTSATYRQSSHTDADLLERDPYNRLYAAQSA